MACPAGGLDRCRGRGIPVVLLRAVGQAGPVAAWRVSSWCRRHGVRILHVRSGPALSPGLLTKAAYPALRLVLTRRVSFPLRGPPCLTDRNRLVGHVVRLLRAVSETMRRAGAEAQGLSIIARG